MKNFANFIVNSIGPLNGCGKVSLCLIIMVVSLLLLSLIGCTNLDNKLKANFNTVEYGRKNNYLLDDGTCVLAKKHYSTGDVEWIDEERDGHKIEYVSSNNPLFGTTEELTFLEVDKEHHDFSFVEEIPLFIKAGARYDYLISQIHKIDKRRPGYSKPVNIVELKRTDKALRVFN